MPGDAPASADTSTDISADAPATEQDSTDTPPESPANAGAAVSEVETPASAETATDAAVTDAERAASEEDAQATPIETTASAARSRFVDAGGIRLHCLEWMEASRSTVLLLHGLTSKALNSDALAQQLEGWFHCIAPNLRGHGDSAWSPDHQYQLSLFVQDLNRFLDAMQLQGVHLVGTALGGDIALAYAGAAGRRQHAGGQRHRPGTDPLRGEPRAAVHPGFAAELRVHGRGAGLMAGNYPMLREYDEALVESFVGYNVRE